MATSHRGMLDVERFDLEPERPPFHGLLGGVELGRAARADDEAEGPVRACGSSTRRASRTAMAASLVEVKETVSTWPQLASDVALGGAMVANAVRRIALGELTGPGASTPTSTTLIADGRQVPLRAAASAAGGAAAPAPPRMPPPARARRRPRGDPLRRRVRDLGAVGRQHAAVALRGGAATSFARRIDPARSSLLDFRGRAALLALGAALEAARDRRARARASSRSRGVAADGPVWELALERSTRAARRGRGRAPVAALLQPAHRRLAADRGGRARRARRLGAPLDVARRAPATRSPGSAPRSARSTACASSRPGCATT